MALTFTPTPPLETDRAVPAGRSSVHIGLGPLLRRLHFYAGILVAPFLFLAALTGLAYAFTPQLEAIAYGEQLKVDTVGTTRLPLSEQVRAAQQIVPQSKLAAVHYPGEPDATTRVEFAVTGGQRTVYVDPYTGEVRGALNTTSGATPVATWLGQMHANLNLGEPGRLYSELAASWLWVLVLGGLALWWRHQRGKRTARRLLLPSGKGVRRSRSVHATIGVWISVVLLFLSATGLTWSEHAGGRFDLLRAQLNSDSIPLKTELGEHDHSGGGMGGTADFDAITRAVGWTGPFTITPSDKAWTVAQTDNTWPVHRDKVAVHPHTGQVVDSVKWADQPVLAQLTSLGIQAHMGVLFGPLNQAALAIVAIGLIVILTWGYRMWWQRRWGSPPPRNSWRQIPIWAAVLAVGIAWAIPLLGWTLLAFLVLDTVRGRFAR